MIEDLTRKPVEVEYASEFRYRRPVIFPSDVVIAISQSGETADTLAAVNLAREAGAFLFGICNVVGSSIARATDTGCYTHIGPEIGVASTKAFTAQVTTLFLLALSLAEQLGTVSGERQAALVQELQDIPDKIAKILEHDAQIADLAKVFTYSHNFLYLGRGYNYPVALEGALKLKEISYIHAEGYPAAEMKHGPIALIDEEMPVVVIAPRRGNRLVFRDSGHGGVFRTHPVHHPAPAAGLPHRHRQGPRCGPAPQPGEISHGRINTSVRFIPGSDRKEQAAVPRRCGYCPDGSPPIHSARPWAPGLRPRRC